MRDRDKITLSRFRGLTDGLYGLAPFGLYIATELDRIQVWGHVARAEGLGIARNRQEAESLRRLADAGLLEAGAGGTTAKTHKLTWNGFIASQELGGLSHAELIGWLDIIDSITLNDAPAMGYELCPTAVAYWEKDTPESKQDYIRELSHATLVLSVFQAMGWANLQTCNSGMLWQVKLTEAGRMAAKNPPESSAELSTGHDAEAWWAGYRQAEKWFPKKDVPSEFTACIPRRLSSGKAWENIFTKSKRRTAIAKLIQAAERGIFKPA